MDKKKLETFKKRLEERQQELRKVVSRTEQDGRAADSETAQDIADKAANSYTNEFLFHQSNNERQLLAMVEGALDRIRVGTFGQCISCGEEINSKRLEAVPWTRFCIACQEKLERGQLENAESLMLHQEAYADDASLESDDEARARALRPYSIVEARFAVSTTSGSCTVNTVLAPSPVKRIRTELAPWG